MSARQAAGILKLVAYISYVSNFGIVSLFHHLTCADFSVFSMPFSSSQLCINRRRNRFVFLECDLWKCDFFFELVLAVFCFHHFTFTLDYSS